MRIAVIDGQGGGIGRVITERLVKALPPEVEILALGTNARATSGMLSAGANEGASGESAILYNAERVDLIVGPLSVVLAHAFLGEMTPSMVTAVNGSPAPKVLLALNRSNVELVGVGEEPLPHLLNKLVARVQGYVEKWLQAAEWTRDARSSFSSVPAGCPTRRVPFHSDRFSGQGTELGGGSH